MVMSYPYRLILMCSYKPQQISDRLRYIEILNIKWNINMNNLLKLLVVLIILILPLKVDAQLAAPTIKLCDTCISSSQFSNIAKSVGWGNVLVVNPSTQQVNKYEVKSAFLWPDYRQVISAKLIPLSNTETSKINQSFQIINDIKNSFNRVNPGILSSHHTSTMEKFSFSNEFAMFESPNGCGAADDWFSNLIPDFPFKSACDSHDMCYESNSLKGVCDGAFRKDMVDIADILAKKHGLDLIILEALINKLFNDMARVYHIGVLVSDEALDSYCASTTNTEAVVCHPDWGTENFNWGDFNYSGRYSYNVPSSGNNSSTPGPKFVSCELWYFPSGLSNGMYYMTRNCG
jgi:hypothetical protein